jgi:stage III sporulation protein AH
MLALMVALSGYYLFTEPVQQIAGEKTETRDQAAAVEGGPAASGTQDALQNGDQAAVASDISGDYFIAYQLRIQEQRSKKKEELENIMSDPDASKEQQATAREQWEYLTKLDDNEDVLQAVIKSEGFSNVVVNVEENRVDVIVQADSLSREEALKIIDLVSSRLEIPGNQVTVGHHI